MNVNTTKLSNSKEPSTGVVSKYFSSHGAMDESLTDFKEKKSAIKGPKTIQKVEKSKLKKKTSKQIKGQKDIRTVLKGNKNELVDYTKQFDDVCKKSGLDVETEQLLLAIALSKSLHKPENTVDESPTSSQSSQQRISKIRTTLQEYGFTVPEIKISKKSRVSKKNYKLLIATETEKQQIISDKYAQVLFVGGNYKFTQDKQLDNFNKNLFYKATNISYKDIKNNNIFYVNGLVEKSSSVGSLLRNWSDIPGRPSSPVNSMSFNMDFSEIECSQEELDIILSGSLKSCKSIMRNKATRSVSPSVTIVVDDESKNVHGLNNKDCIKHFNSESIALNTEYSLNVEKEINNSKQRSSASTYNSSGLEKSSVVARSITRSSSPDIFDDEASGILENGEEKKDIIYTQIINDIIEDNNKSIDLTQNSNDKDDTSKSLKYCQNKNFTRKLSNDMMEITECVATSSLTQSFTKSHNNYLSNKSHCLSQPSQSNKTKILNDIMEFTKCVGNSSIKSKSVSKETNVDLTQDSDEDVETPVSNFNPICNRSHTSSIDDELPSVKPESSNDESLDATIILNNNEIDIVLKSCTNKDNNESKTYYKEPHAVENASNLLETVKSSQSFFDEFEHEHSDNTAEINEKSKSIEYEVFENEDKKDSIDLTQSSDDAIEVISLKQTNLPLDEYVLGKNNEVSVDYDELCNNEIENSKEVISNASNLSQESKLSRSYDDDNLVNSKSMSETSNQNSVGFEVYDEELNYSVNKSRCEAAWVDFGGISIMDDLSKLENTKNLPNESRTKMRDTNSLSKSMSDSFLPMITIKGSSAKENVALGTLPKDTPIKELSNSSKEYSAKTPVASSEYVIKTDQVTPMLDYASMSTPERNRELDKYGLKPFKRKRAVQILTHLYNQTHPLVEPDDMPSPSKKLKRNDNILKCFKSPKKNESELKSPKKNEGILKSPKNNEGILKSPKKNEGILKSPKNNERVLKSPKKNEGILKSPKKNEGILKSPKNIEGICNKESNLFSVTKQLPDILAIECLEDDWVFQKREKAKLHSCRVPLHIAFHNYVSCRELLREAILRYEPVNIDEIHKGLVAIGFRYDPKDLLKFMDKKCITVKTADNNARNNKR